MPTPIIRDFYTCLCRQNKPGKVVVVVAMCKWLLALNACSGNCSCGNWAL